MERISPKISYQIWVLKVIAIFTIFFAHMPLYHEGFTETQYFWTDRIFQLLGITGVPLFFFLSGYLFKKGKLIKRSISLLIPLFLWGTISYLIHCLGHHETFNLWGLISRLLGSNSYLYFVFVLFWIILFNNIIGNNLFWIIIGVCSIILSQLKLIPYNSFFTIYMNPFNFILFFALGKVFRYKKLWHPVEYNKPLFFLSLVIVIVTFFIPNFYTQVWYFNIISLFVNVSLIIVLLYVTKSLTKKYNFIVQLGECTYIIYLTHISIASFLNRFLDPYLGGFFSIIKIIIAFLLASSLVYIGYYLLNKYKCNKLMKILGYRS